MSFFSKIGKAAASLWRGITSTPDVTKDIFDKDGGLLSQAGHWIDGLSYTNQEKAEALKQMVDQGVEFVKSTIDESSERSKTRRSIAILWIRFELFLLAVSLIATPFDPQLAAHAFALATTDIMAWGTFAVLGFFFGAHILGRGIFGKTK